ncbi:manganese transporter, partial [Actinomyces sp. S6-Spd3]
SLASTSVGAYAGSEIMGGLLHVRVPLWARRLVTLIPALIVLWVYPNPSWALVISQVALSFGIPFAIIPLTWYTASKDVMGDYRDGTAMKIAMAAVSALIVALNFALIYLTFTGVDMPA